MTSIRSTGLNADLEVLRYTERMGLVEYKKDGKQAETTYEYDDYSAYARFRSPDPTGQEPNQYNYAQGDPINNSDPTGARTGSTWGSAPRWAAAPGRKSATTA
ncbi:hypothetical protein [Lentzea cavernae]|uniref:RHS repeat-associated core domain-containing protein n=1 Tax=Lentzea cavernae TaxID=2020703 RepID=A0ABQ3M327_9PSEU|nr:hypothetical protein [Lentzea cavernae]GHH32471.1 hypothetical protein GCM10017774_13430 [Lentzea cavernae]